MWKTVFGGLAAAAVSLAFLACDGPLPGYYSVYGKTSDTPSGEQILFRGRVFILEDPETEGDDRVEKPVKGIAVYVEGITDHYAYLTDAKGEFSFYVPKQKSYSVVFADIDDDRNGEFRPYEDEYSLAEIEGKLYIDMTKCDKNYTEEEP